MEKTKDYTRDFLKSKTTLIALICLIVYLISGYCEYLQFLIVGISLVYFLIAPAQDGLCLLVFLMSFSHSSKWFCLQINYTPVVFVVAVGIKYFVGVKNDKYKFDKKLWWAICIFMLVSTIVTFVGLNSLKDVGFQAWAYIFYLPGLYFAGFMKKEFDVPRIMTYLFVGLVLSCAISPICFVLPHYSYKCLASERFSAFIFHPNYVYMMSLILLTYFMYLFLNDRIKMLTFLSLYAILTIIILLTFSKTGFFMLILFSFVFLILFIRKDKKRGLQLTLILCALALIIGAVAHKVVFEIIHRLFMYDDDVLNSITTGRIDIWKEYFSSWSESVFSILFGQGLFAKQVFIPVQNRTRASHNLYVFLLWRFGIVGCVVLGIVVYKIYKIYCDQRPTISAWLPIAFFMLDGMCENTFKVHNYAYYIVCLLILASATKECGKVQKVENSSKNSNK